MLVEVLCADVGRVDVGRDEVDGNPSLRHELSDEEEAQRDVLRPRAEGAVSQRVQRCCVVAVQRHFRKVLAEPSLSQHVRAEHCFLHRQSRRDQLRLHGRHGSQTLKPRLEANRRIAQQFTFFFLFFIILYIVTESLSDPIVQGFIYPQRPPRQAVDTRVCPPFYPPGTNWLHFYRALDAGGLIFPPPVLVAFMSVAHRGCSPFPLFSFLFSPDVFF